ncbi:ExbD/TolR family protein [Seonamhaeicola algicola]|nr:hypothetical protein [Seonamhaeicola algicola]
MFFNIIKNNFTVITIIFLVFSGYGQMKDIDLPIGGVDTINLSEIHYAIHYTKNQELYFNGQRLRFWDQLPNAIRAEKRYPKGNAVSNIIIYADKGLEYAYIERIRHEIGKVWSGYLHFKSDGYENSNCLTFYISGSAMYNKGYDLTNWYYGPKIIYTTKEYIGEDKMPTLEASSPMIPVFWQHNFSDEFFDIHNYSKRIKKILEGENDASITIKTDSLYTFNNEYVKFSDTTTLTKIIDNNDILFVKTRVGLSYEKHFKAMTKIQERRKHNKEHGVLRKPFIIEVPFIYEEELVKKEIKLFN